MLNSTQSMAPFFSIVIPSYNCAQYIQQTLRSIYNQTEQDYEIIVINDGSTDNLIELLALESDSRLKVITQNNGGVSRARNRGIQEAHGTYIAFLDSDDIWLPFHLEKAKYFLTKHPEFNWYVTNVIHAKQINDSDFLTATDTNGSYYKSNWFLEFAPLPIASSCIVKTGLAKRYLHFPEDIKMFEDNIAWSQFAIHAGPIGSYEHETCIYRRRADSATENYQSLWKNNTLKIGSEALLIQQNMLQKSTCPLEARFFFKMRSLSNWGNNLSCIKLKEWRNEILRRRHITGFFLTFFLLLYAYSLCLITRIMQKLISIRYNQLARKLNKMLNKEKKAID